MTNQLPRLGRAGTVVALHGHAAPPARPTAYCFNATGQDLRTASRRHPLKLSDRRGSCFLSPGCAVHCEKFCARDSRASNFFQMKAHRAPVAPVRIGVLHRSGLDPLRVFPGYAQARVGRRLRGVRFSFAHTPPRLRGYGPASARCGHDAVQLARGRSSDQQLLVFVAPGCAQPGVLVSLSWPSRARAFSFLHI